MLVFIHHKENGRVLARFGESGIVTEGKDENDAIATLMQKLLSCPHCNHALTDAELKRLWAQRNAARQTPHPGPGRPRKAKRCPCGAMTVNRAKQRDHKCAGA